MSGEGVGVQISFAGKRRNPAIKRHDTVFKTFSIMKLNNSTTIQIRMAVALPQNARNHKRAFGGFALPSNRSSLR